MNLRESVKSVVKKKAFTIVELLVAMTLLVILLGLSGMVFNTTVQAHRAAGASIDVSRNLRAITEQLSNDLRGLRKDAPLFIKFYSIGNARHDLVHFFADGDFQSTKQYAGQTIYGNVARIYYGHANSVDIFNDPGLTPDYYSYQTLARKTHILTADAGIKAVYGQIPLISSGGLIDYTQFATDFLFSNNFPNENQLEFDTITLTEWINALNFLNAGNPDNADAFVDNCMDDGTRPFIDLSKVETLHLLMAQGVIEFQVQWAYTTNDLVTVAGLPVPWLFAGVRWWPSDDPDGDPSTVGSDFDVMAGLDIFGVYLRMPNGSSFAQWHDVVSANPAKRCRANDGSGGAFYFKDNFYPAALKFTFTLKDSNGIFADGKTFTHIVYLDN
ncbi:MAG: prepilin-type N-terminal cleavage/methylation domain-containing protein [Phycisphaerae bacterium]|nr:prepilin-type N-terminal cleavage/methylation domain-containing protein [Phycisphaerae bacterium]